MKNSKLLQQITKLEEQISVMSQESDHKDQVESPLGSHLQSYFSQIEYYYNKNII